MESPPRVVIVGAGFAGLGAATTLANHGWKDLVILEALDRAGGRVFTLKRFGAPALELGATWIHGQVHNPLYQLAKDKGLLAGEGFNMASGQPATVTQQDYFFSEEGRLLPSSDVDQVTGFFGEIMCKIYQQDFNPEHAALSVGTYLDQEFGVSTISNTESAEGIYEWCKRMECVDEACNSMYEFALSQLGLYTALEGPFYTNLGCGGYQALLNSLLDQLPPNTLHCHKPVKSIRWEGPQSKSPRAESPVIVQCEDGEEFPADHVIVTASLGYLKERASSLFDPPLPEGKMQAIQRLGFGTVAKIFLEFSEPFWPDDCAGIQFVWKEGPESPHGYAALNQEEALPSQWYKKIGGFDCVPVHRSTICGWITGKAAEYMETLPEKEVGDVCVSLLKRFTGWPVSDLREVLRSTWYSNPYIRGSYTNVPLGVDAVKEQRALEEPIPSAHHIRMKLRPLQVLFAGEATHINFYTTTHGAFLSGVREAERILEHYETRASARL